jgi:thioredoxin-like negative regulator of GroEL
VTTPELPRRLVRLIANAYVLAGEVPNLSGALAIVRLLRAVAPTVPQLDLLEAQELLAVRNFAAARQLLEQADAAVPGDAMTKALLAATLFRQRDRMWEFYLNEVKALPPQPRALRMIGLIEKASRNEPLDDEEADIKEATPSEQAAPHTYVHFGVAC